MEGTFWMDGYLATRPVRVSQSLAALDGELDPDAFYAVFGSFEGHWQILQFAGVEKEQQLSSGSISRSVVGHRSWSSTLSRDEYIEYVRMIRREIERGWVYQVNACRLLHTDDEINLKELFSRILDEHPAPAAGYFKSGNWEVASASPETFFKVEKRQGRSILTTRPIKGTSRDGNFQPKDSAENVMIVDLMRNDISPLTQPGTVRVPKLLETEAHPGLFHLVSDVEGELRADISWSAILERLSPAGSISGAPKSSALDVISSREEYRGAYCGTLGWIHDGQAHFSVLIRTFFKDSAKAPGRTFFGTGAGITWGSDPSTEWEETELKAERLMALCDGLLAAGQ